MNIDVKYKVEKGIPIPVRSASPALRLAKLEVGESIVFPLSKRAAIQSNASRTKASNGRNFTVKKINSTECRVWRTA